jgi:hypothetical protein
MKRLNIVYFFLVPVALLAGCLKKINPESNGLTCDQATDVCPIMLSLSPAGTTYTNKMVTIAVQVAPADHPPDQIQLLRNNQKWMVLTPPSFAFAWDTTKEAEASYQISASATVAGTVVPSNTITIDVDRTAPTVTYQPKANASNVALSDPILVTFSEPVDPTTVSGTSVKLTNASGTDLAATSTLSTDMTTLTVSISNMAALTFPAAITGNLDPTVKDRAGNAVGTPPTWSWTAPLWVKLPSFLASFESLALDSAGRAYLAYGTNGSTASSLSVVRYAVGSTWDSSLGSPTTDLATTASIGISSVGTPVVAWSADHVRAAQWNGSAWSALGANIEASVPATTTSVFLSSLAFATIGPVVGWTGNQGSSDPAYVAVWSGSTWQTLPAGAAAGLGGPLLRADSSGTLIGRFAGGIGTNPSIAAYQNGAWSTLLQNNALLLGLAIDSQGRPVSLSQEQESGLEVIHVQVLTGTGWVDLTPSLATGSAQNVGEAQVAIDPAGNPVLLWLQEDSSSNDVLSVARFNGAGWDTTFGTLTGVANGNGSVFSADLEVDASGAPTVAWIEEDMTTFNSSVFTWRSNR